MNREQIEQRLVMLQRERAGRLQQREAATADIHAFTGAIQDCEFWLSQLPSELSLVPAETTHEESCEMCPTGNCEVLPGGEQDASDENPAEPAEGTY